MTRPKSILGDPLERGDVIYERDIRHLVEPQRKGDFVVIDVYSGDYEIAERSADAARRLMDRRPNAMAWSVHIGYPGPRPWPRMWAAKVD